MLSMLLPLSVIRLPIKCWCPFQCQQNTFTIYDGVVWRLSHPDRQRVAGIKSRKDLRGTQKYRVEKSLFYGIGRQRIMLYLKVHMFLTPQIEKS